MIGIAEISESWDEAPYPRGTLTWRGGVDHSVSSAGLACGEMPFALSASVKPGHEILPLWSTHQDLLCLRVTSPELGKVYTSLTVSLECLLYTWLVPATRMQQRCVAPALFSAEA